MVSIGTSSPNQCICGELRWVTLSNLSVASRYVDLTRTSKFFLWINYISLSNNAELCSNTCGCAAAFIEANVGYSNQHLAIVCMWRIYFIFRQWQFFFWLHFIWRYRNPPITGLLSANNYIFCLKRVNYNILDPPHSTSECWHGLLRHVDLLAR